MPRYVETVKLLLARGAKAHLSVFGETPLKMAQDATCEPLVKLLEPAVAAEQEALKSAKAVASGGKAARKKKR